MKRIAGLMIIMLLICAIAEADNSARIAELNQEAQEWRNDIANYKEIVVAPVDAVRGIILDLRFLITGNLRIIKELQAQDIEAKERVRRIKERIAAKEKAKEEVEIPEAAPVETE